jgi:4-amino-4-deoxy-L-arabinose transferase-like glycosyltransferase
VKIRLLPKNKSGESTIDTAVLKKFLIAYYPLLSVLIGFMLVSLSVGPYHNGDTAWEYDAVSGVTKYGLPYANSSYLIDQPPLGFYIQAGFLTAFGTSITNGTFLVTLFGLGSVILVYLIAMALYNQTTGFFAAAFFAFSPWHIILSRSFLIDGVCLFFSLLSLFIGIIAIRRDSFKLILTSGIVFAAAFNTKLYAGFILIPLLALFIYHRPINFKRTVSWVTAFSLPALVTSYLWYQIIAGTGLISIFSHADFVIHEPTSIAPSYFFVSNFLVSYGLGWFFIDAVILSLIAGLAFRRVFPKLLVFDAVFVVAIIFVLGVNTFLGTTLNLNAPYLNAIKYDYQALPFFCLLAASLITKSISLFNSGKTKPKLNKIVFFLVASAGFILVTVTLLYNMRYVYLLAGWNYLLFRVEPNVNLGYSLFSSSPIGVNSVMMGLQFFGFATAVSGIIWASRHRISLWFKLSRRTLREKRLGNNF